MSARMDAGPLAPRDAYRLWAHGYDAENAVSALENAAVLRVTPPLAERALLDVGCGTGRRLPATGARHCVGVDLVFEMLAAGDVHAATARRIAGDVRALPLAPNAFDVIWCRLVLGHVPHLSAAYRELARVASPGATLVVTDFHPAAIAAGHTRTFRDAGGALHAIEHHVHTAAQHCTAAAAAGWRLGTQHEPAVGAEVRPFYARAGVLDRFEAERGLPLVLLLAFQR